jgi:hypothetical protein
MLDKPYMDGGHEHSGRIAKKGDEKKNNHDYYDVEEQKTATLVVKGELNQTGCNKVIWDVEIALAHSDTLKFQQRHLQGAPKVGDLWRINFSRVERKGNVNWTWQPQRVWKVENHTYCGQVNMHLPDAWGYVRFGPSLSEIKGHAGKAAPAAGQVPKERIVEQGDPFWPLRWTVMNIYYAQRYYYDKNGVYATDMNQLNDLVDKDTLDPFRENMILKASKDCYTIQMFDDNHCYISLNHTRYMKVWKEEEEEGSNIVNMY